MAEEKVRERLKKLDEIIVEGKKVLDLESPKDRAREYENLARRCNSIQGEFDGSKAHYPHKFAAFYSRKAREEMQKWNESEEKLQQDVYQIYSESPMKDLLELPFPELFMGYEPNYPEYHKQSERGVMLARTHLFSHIGLESPFRFVGDIVTKTKDEMQEMVRRYNMPGGVNQKRVNIGKLAGMVKNDLLPAFNKRNGLAVVRGLFQTDCPNPAVLEGIVPEVRLSPEDSIPGLFMGMNVPYERPEITPKVKKDFNASVERFNRFHYGNARPESMVHPVIEEVREKAKEYSGENNPKR